MDSRDDVIEASANETCTSRHTAFAFHDGSVTFDCFEKNSVHSYFFHIFCSSVHTV